MKKETYKWRKVEKKREWKEEIKEGRDNEEKWMNERMKEWERMRKNEKERKKESV